VPLQDEERLITCRAFLRGEQECGRSLLEFLEKFTFCSDELLRSAAGAGGPEEMQEVVTGELGLSVLGPRQSVSGLVVYPEGWDWVSR
jgi:hypothetical protein